MEIILHVPHMSVAAPRIPAIMGLFRDQDGQGHEGSQEQV